MNNSARPPAWVANPDWWTYAGPHLPWLRPDSRLVHVVKSGLEQEVSSTLGSAGYEVVSLTDDIQDREALMNVSKERLRLREYCWPGWDSWSDCLLDLNELWPHRDRLALLWPRSDLLLRAVLPSWLVATRILREAGVFLATKPEFPEGWQLAPDYVPHRLFVFETFCFVRGLGAQAPEE